MVRFLTFVPITCLAESVERVYSECIPILNDASGSFIPSLTSPCRVTLLRTSSLYACRNPPSSVSTKFSVDTLRT